MLRVKKYQLSIDITVPLNISMVFLRSGKTFDVIVERNAMAWSETEWYDDDVEWSALARNEAVVVIVTI